MEKTLQTTCGEGKWKVNLTLIETMPKKGIIVVLTGGEEPHVGAIAIAIPCSIVQHAGKMTSSISVFVLPGHMDDKVAVPLAKKLSEKLNELVVVVCGLHIHNATTQDIKRLVRNSNKAVNRITKKLLKSLSP